MRSKGVVAAAALTGALVTGGWLLERGHDAPRDARAQARLFDDVLQHLRRDYVDTLADSALYRRAVAGLVEELHDPQSVYLDAERFRRLQTARKGGHAGIGAQLEMRDSGLVVIGALPGAPADDAGIEAGDRIIEIDDRSTVDLTADEARAALAGGEGTAVHLSIERPGVAARLQFRLVRAKLDVEPVRHARMLADRVGYVELAMLSDSAASDLSNAVDSLRALGARALVLDLRGTAGESLEGGVAVADIFLDSAARIVSTRGQSPEDIRSYADRSPQRYAGMPLVVLTDVGTGSAGEIVAGALQDHDRALVVGATTHGMGSAQRLFPLDEGALELTTALWYTPGGRGIHRMRPSDEANDGTSAVAPDTTTPRPEFMTDAGRRVLGGGGIVPDVAVPAAEPTKAERALIEALGEQLPRFHATIVDYALALKSSRRVRDVNFAVTPAMRDELFRRITARKIELDRATYDRAATTVDRELGSQIARAVFGSRVQLDRSLREDAAVAKALERLRGVELASELVTPPHPVLRK